MPGRRRGGAPGRDAGFLGTGHYPIPALEESLGLSSPKTVVFTHDSNYIYKILEMTFKSILDSPADSGEMLQARQIEEISEQSFTDAVLAVIQHLQPGIEVLPSEELGGKTDFAIAYRGRTTFVQTTWVHESDEAQTIDSLSELIDGLPDGARLLVVVNSSALPGVAASELIARRLHERGLIISWQEINGGAELEMALRNASRGDLDVLPTS